MGLRNRLLGKPNTTRLSLIVVIYRMPRQAANTLLSLSTVYQRGVTAQEYEVIVVENSSDRELGREAAERHGSNIRYFYREETQPSPVPAARFGVQQSQGEILGLVIDGARMASPGLVEHVLKASLTHPRAVVAVPGYHLGDTVQQEAMNHGYNEDVEASLLKNIDWPANGYQLFDIACFSRSGGQGFFRPNSESNCLCLPRTLWEEVGGLDPAFTETGGGQANPDLYKRVCELPGIELVLTPGEGTFHQFHGGVTTGTPPEVREQHMHNHFEQYKALRGEYFKAPETTARLYGAVPENALRFMQRSVQRALNTPREKSGVDPK
jgi:hypothetical protein